MFEIGDLVMERETIYYHYSIGVVIHVEPADYKLGYNQFDDIVTVIWMDGHEEILESKFLIKLESEWRH